jgi:hypothetical protein
MSVNKNNKKLVAEEVWPWRQDVDVLPEVHVAGRRRQALKESVGMLVVGGTFTLLSRNVENVGWLRHPGMLALCLCVIVFVGGMWVPALYRGVKCSFEFLASVLGTVMAWLLFPPVFYVCFTLARIVRLIKGVDTLGRKFPTDKKTYWVEWKAPEDLDSYKHQF